MSKPPLKTVFVAVALVATAALALGTGSCGSNTVPPPISPQQRRFISKAHFPLTVGVERYKAPIYSTRLIEQLRATKLFVRVDDISKFETRPDLIARIEYPIYGSPTIPVKTFVTAGILSTNLTEEHGQAFSLRSAKCSDMRVPITFKYTGETTIGWWAVLLNLQPDHMKRDPESHPNFLDNLAWRVAREADAFIAMKRQGC